MEIFDMVQFDLGQVVCTPGALEVTDRAGILGCVKRHHSGDWGDTYPADKKANDAALISGGRLVSRYNFPNGERLLIITEWDRSYTTAMRPSDY